MAFKVLGQLNPSASVYTTLYTCATTKFVGNIFVCNQSSTPATVDIYTLLASGGQGVQTGQVSTQTLDGNYIGLLSTGLNGINGSLVRVRASTANVSFSFFGDES